MKEYLAVQVSGDDWGPLWVRADEAKARISEFEKALTDLLNFCWDRGYHSDNPEIEQANRLLGSQASGDEKP